MLRYSNLSFVALILTFLIGGSCFTAFGQPIWLDRSADKAITLEILKPNFADEDETTFSTSAWFLTGRFAVCNIISLVWQIPFTIYGRDYNGSSESQDAFGNIYSGIEIHGQNSPVFGEIGVYLPTAPGEPDAPRFVGFLTLTDWVDRWEAFLHEVLTINATINYYQTNPGGLVLRFRGGPSIWFDTNGGIDQHVGDKEVMLLYAVQVGYAAPKFELLTGLSGRWWITAEDAAAELFGDIHHQIGFAANVALGNFRPGATFRVPIDEMYSDAPDFVFGLTLGINLP
jgi:hypothetical protein